MNETTQEARPTAAENCAWVREALARKGEAVHERPMTMAQTVGWLHGQGLSVGDIDDGIRFVTYARTRIGRGPGWRLLSSGALRCVLVTVGDGPAETRELDAAGLVGV